MRGDPGGEVSCPKCGEVRRARRPYRTPHGTTTTHRTLRALILDHIRSNHPELGPRPASLLADRALEAARFGEAEIISAPGA